MNRASYAYKKARANFLARHEDQGWWRCWRCGGMTNAPELDHVNRTGMGGSPSLLMDESNWQILCGAGFNNCHGRKDSGLQFKA